MTDNLIRIPLGGNAFLESTASGGIVTERGITNWHDPRAVFGIYIRLRSASRFRAAIRMRPQTREATLRLTCGSRTLEAAVPEGASEVSFGDFETTAPGYVRFELSGVSKSGNLFASPTELVLYGITPEDADAYVPPDERNNYYWTRRGPSVHGTYDLSGIGETEPGGGVFGVVEHVARRLIDRNGTGVGRRIRRFLSDVKLKGFEFIVTHFLNPFFFPDASNNSPRARS